MSESILTQVTGRDRSLLGGVVTADDADAASLFDMARNILGNPYEDEAGSHGDGDGPLDPVVADGAVMAGEATAGEGPVGPSTTDESAIDQPASPPAGPPETA